MKNKKRFIGQVCGCLMGLCIAHLFTDRGLRKITDTLVKRPQK